MTRRRKKQAVPRDVVAKMLRRLSSNMEVAAAALANVEGDTIEATRHANEMRGAARIANTWGDGLEAEGRGS